LVRALSRQRLDEIAVLGDQVTAESNRAVKRIVVGGDDAITGVRRCLPRRSTES
jgi:hypothetical protein